MRLVAVLAVLCAASSAAAEINWFTVTGNPQRTDVDTIQVDPVALSRAAGTATMRVRVSRAAERTNWFGVPYRSYEGEVLFRCDVRQAEYLRATYFLEPLWRGPSHRVDDYKGERPPMRFKGVDPNPTERIVRAACGG